MPATCSGWCTPTIIYAAIASISAIALLFTKAPNETEADSLARVLKHLLMSGLWTGLLYVLCYYCYNTAAWAVIILPFVMAVLSLVFLSSILFYVGKQASKHPHRDQNDIRHRMHIAAVPFTREHMENKEEEDKEEDEEEKDSEIEEFYTKPEEILSKRENVQGFNSVDNYASF